MSLVDVVFKNAQNKHFVLYDIAPTKVILHLALHHAISFSFCNKNYIVLNKVTLCYNVHEMVGKQRDIYVLPVP